MCFRQHVLFGNVRLYRCFFYNKARLPLLIRRFSWKLTCILLFEQSLDQFSSFVKTLPSPKLFVKSSQKINLLNEKKIIVVNTIPRKISGQLDEPRQLKELRSLLGNFQSDSGNHDHSMIGCSNRNIVSCEVCFYLIISKIYTLLLQF